MWGTKKAKEMKRRESQRRATHKARHAALMLRVETRMAKVVSKGPVKSTAKVGKATKRR